MNEPLTRRNSRTMLTLFGVVAGMVGLSFASVPLYRIFCQVTGFGGTTQVGEAVSEGKVGDRVVKVRFDSMTNGLPWRFFPEQREVSVRVGESRLAFYRAENIADYPVSGTATFNVTPLKAGQYFVKIECFCFTEQRLTPGESVDMPVTFYVDPSIENDPNMADVSTITLSYTFFPMKGEGRDRPDNVTKLDRTDRNSEVH